MDDDLALPGSGLIEDLPSRQFLRGIFHLLFGREPVLSDDDWYVQQLESGRLSPRQLVEWLTNSPEWTHGAPMDEFGPSLHYGRGVFIRRLPRARRILDIGGAALGDPSGALVVMGYPYAFDELVIVDLPSEERHPLYRDESRPDTVRTPQGRVTYRYHSMTDLNSYPSGSFDLVYSGQSIEHVTRREADSGLSQVRRVLAPGGFLATGAFDVAEVATKRGLFHAIADCYLLSYVCRRPVRPRLGTEFDRAAWTVAGSDARATRIARRGRRLLSG